jgi:predicted nucleic acid-binding protein
MRSVLIDAGPLIALFAVDDKYHGRFDSLVSDMSADGLRLLTTWPCVVEASYLLGVPQRFECLEWLRLGGAVVYSFDTTDLGDIANWMRRYTEPGKRDMDLADASLVWLADKTGVRGIMTVDIGDFSRYRLPDGSAFVLL